MGIFELNEVSRTKEALHKLKAVEFKKLRELSLNIIRRPPADSKRRRTDGRRERENKPSDLCNNN